MKKNIVVILHLYYHDLWNEFASYLSNIEEPFDLCISLCKDHDNEKIQEIIKKDFPVARFLIVENLGADIKPFFDWLNVLKKEQCNYKYILKIHSKKTLRKKSKTYGKNWRKHFLKILLGNKDQVQKILTLLGNDAGIVSAKKYLSPVHTNHKSRLEEKITRLYMLKKFNLKDTSNANFFAGTMFWCRYDILNEYIEMEDLSNEFYYIDDSWKRKIFAIERFFNLFFINKKLKVIGI